MDARKRAAKNEMTRTYTLKKRADSQAETRRRIVEAAVELHGTIGPARTTFSMVAGRAGVQRHTLYAHFPDERSLTMACSALAMERDPLPDAAPWRAIEDRRERLRTGLAAIHAWYERNAQLVGCVLRDAEYDPLIQEIAGLRMGPYLTAYHDVLGAKLTMKQRAVLHLALSFHTWRTLTEAGLKRAGAVRVLVQAIESASEA
jgi:AcrR family transcriptional regulator